MPIYEYRCLEQGHTFELLQKMGEAPPERCPVCQGSVTRLISVSVRPRNAGIYIFDRRTGRDILHDD
jgi:putative FmdB family regulatory protein